MSVLCEINIQILGNSLEKPTYSSKSAAGIDLEAAIKDDVVIKRFHRALLPTGVKIAIPPGFEGQIRPRSGFALNHGITVLNTPGTIESDYRGEIKVLLINFGESSFIVKAGMRIAQLVIANVVRPKFSYVNQLKTGTLRGEEGFGSTGLK